MQIPCTPGYSVRSALAAAGSIGDSTKWHIQSQLRSCSALAKVVKFILAETPAAIGDRIVSIQGGVLSE